MRDRRREFSKVKTNGFPNGDIPNVIFCKRILNRPLDGIDISSPSIGLDSLPLGK